MNNFKDLNISEPVMRAITELGYEAPTPIQAETLPLLLGADTDFLGMAATGTGKTAAFGIPLLERIKPDLRGVQAVILCPTRELAIQVGGQIDLLGKYLGIKALPIYGGTGYGDQIYGLKNGASIVVGTPGRVVDHIEKGTLRLDNLQTLVLDEADEMISMGFKEDLETVLAAAPKEQANIWLFSATMGADVKHVADAYLTEPQKVQVNRTEMLPVTVEQIFYKLHEYDKPEALCKLIDMADDFYGIVFCQTKALVADLHQFLLGKGYRADCLHGDLDQTARDRVMKAFRDRKVSILIATDVACRGLDVKDITHVVNYSIPRELDNYVHRIGRTGRSGKKGLAFSFVTFSHRELIGRIERMTKTMMKEGFIPSARDISLKRITKVRTAFETQGPQGRAASMISPEWKEALAGMTPEDVASRFLNMLLPDMFADKPKEERMADSRPVAAPQERSQRPERRGGYRDERREAPRGYQSRAPRARDSAPRDRDSAPRNHDSAPRSRDDAGGERPRFKPKFAEKRSFSARPAPWKKTEERSERPASGEFAPAPVKQRWRKDPARMAEAASRSYPSSTSKAGPTAGGGESKFKKKFGHWKSKKEKPGGGAPSHS